MKLQKQIRDDMVKAMKLGEKEKVTLLKVLIGDFCRDDFYKKEMNNLTVPLPDENVIKIIRKMSETAKDYIELGVDIEKNKNEIKVLGTYLPSMLSEDHIKLIVEGIIEARGFSGMQHMGKVMGELKSHPKASLINGKISSKIVKETLMK